MRSLGSGSSNSAEIKGLQGRDGLRGPVSLFLNENPGREGEKFCPDLLRLGFIVNLNFHFLGLGLGWEGITDGETEEYPPIIFRCPPQNPPPKAFLSKTDSSPETSCLKEKRLQQSSAGVDGVGWGVGTLFFGWVWQQDVGLAGSEAQKR